MRRDPVQAALQALAEAARRPHDVATLALVRDALAHRSNHVVGRAARAAREAEFMALAADLVAAFPRFLVDPVRRDPGCVAKAEIVHALLSFGHAAPEVFLAGAAHVQREPAFGPPIDTAAELRAISAMALVVTGHPAALTTCVGLLVDPEPAARRWTRSPPPRRSASTRTTRPCSTASAPHSPGGVSPHRAGAACADSTSRRYCRSLTTTRR